MISDYNRQTAEYEAYRQCVPDAPPPLTLSEAPANVYSLFAPFDQFIRDLVANHTASVLTEAPQSEQDVSDRYYASRLVFSVNSDTSINAFADYSPHGYYIVSLNAGLFAAMRMIFRHLFLHSFIFPEVGPAPADSSMGTIRPIDYTIDDLPSFLNSIPQPKPETRAHVSDVCAIMATVFTVYHELRHVFGGHIDLERKNCRFARLREVEEGAESSRPTNTRRAIEHDADKAAILEIAHFALDMPPLAPGCGVEINGALCAFALTTLFFVFDHERTEFDVLARNHYPHPEIRAFQSFTDITMETVLGAAANRARAVSFAIPNLGRVPPHRVKEMLTEATREAFLANLLLGRRCSSNSFDCDTSVALTDVFPDKCSIDRYISTLDAELSSLKDALKDAQEWARRQA